MPLSSHITMNEKQTKESSQPPKDNELPNTQFTCVQRGWGRKGSHKWKTRTLESCGLRSPSQEAGTDPYQEDFLPRGKGCITKSAKTLLWCSFQMRILVRSSTSCSTTPQGQHLVHGALDEKDPHLHLI